ncbi:metabolite-proton symporter [Saccharopolyspora erythraea NRRL 2338]|uniref:MFS transporter n=2 Tax=Saccharopolyspora erythraea TaxID=1836 RepID=A0ABN1CPP3_SACER|nr:MFS transporter [Saccharopolyspora erythraea]EQD83632.1 MFS transporter [Saccharopolyspora erythraea D]PFG96124.1 metabolite-proton symporter [Saccharopolyspora erythraea NRRL 2338]QRK92660.1 MHS family MFS transporter [Saccharopolyspora erythraea]CAM02398.1 probable metabolite transporter, MFS superfamily [Saccharopolyspora erythraea NRRL 2338]
MSSTATKRTGASSAPRTLTSSTIGSVIEWYDFTIYGTAAALIFNRLFFSDVSPTAGTLAAFGTFAAGFIARPLGGFVAGHYGDRLGRKAMLVTTLLLMGAATTLIGLLPTYGQVGVIAPVLLVVLRLVQGFAVGGEWGGAVLMAVEHAPDDKRGRYGAWPQTGVSAGLLLGTGVFSRVSALPEPQLLAWGWRVPFLLSIVLAVVGLYIRFRISEPESFAAATAAEGPARRPLVEVLRTHPKQILIAVGVRFAEGGNYYVFTVFILSYLTQQLGLPRQAGLTGVMLAAALNIVALPLWGALSDRVGRRPVFIGGALFMAAYAWPFFLLVDTRSPALVALALAVALAVPHGAVFAPIAAFYTELFEPRVRYSGVSIGYQIGSVLLGGFTPLLATSLIMSTGGASWSVAALVAAGALVAAASMFAAPETFRRSLHAGREPESAVQKTAV